MLALGFSANASEGFAVTVDENFLLTVAYSDAESDSRISLEDRSGQILFSEGISVEKGRSKTLSLEVLPGGTYYVILENSLSKISAAVLKTANGLELISGEREVVFKPTYKIEGDIVLLSVTNPMESRTSIKVYDKNGTLVGDINKSGLVVKQAMDFSAVPSGIYRIDIKVGKNSFSKEVTIS